jgi:hypothetical protein
MVRWIQHHFEEIAVCFAVVAALALAAAAPFVWGR